MAQVANLEIYGQYRGPLRHAILGAVVEEEGRDSTPLMLLGGGGILSLYALVWFRQEVAFHLVFYWELIKSLCT